MLAFFSETIKLDQGTVQWWKSSSTLSQTDMNRPSNKKNNWVTFSSVSAEKAGL